MATPKNYVPKRKAPGVLTEAEIQSLEKLIDRTKARRAAKRVKRRSQLARSVKDGGLDTSLPKKKRRKDGSPGQVAASVGGRCGAKTNRGTGPPCNQMAGFGTDHPGLGRCKYHGGASSVGIGHAVQERARLMGAPIDMNPIEAIIWSIRITAGEVKWLSEKIAELDEVEGVENTIMGKQFHLYVRERRDRVALLHRMGLDALKLGLAERAIKMAEMYGVALSRFIMGILDDLNLTPEQAQLAPSVVRKHLVILEGNKPIVEPQKVIEEAIEVGAEEVDALVAV